jgi:hypothetical protein
MILALSNHDDWSTNDVVEWLKIKEKPFKRFNFNHFAQASIKMTVGENSRHACWQHIFQIPTPQ